MPEISIVNIAGEIVDNLADTLRTTTVGGKPFFSQVEIANDAASFLRISNPLAAESNSYGAGIVAGAQDERPGRVDFELALCRIPITIIIRFLRKRPPGAGEADPVRESMRVAEIVKAAVMRDRSRGGRCRLMQWGGDVLNCTEVTGNVRPLARVPNEAFFAATIPVACGWIVETPR